MPIAVWSWEDEHVPKLVRWQPDGATFEAEPGERLLDAIDDHPQVWLPTACRSANCGTCRVRVVRGEAGVIPADPWEADVLAQHGAAADERLGCQLCFTGDTASDAESEAELIILERLP